MRGSIAVRLQWSLSRARSSAGERSPHTREVAGSNPAAPMLKALLFREILSDIAGNRAPVQALVPESRLLSPVAGDAGRFRAAAGGRGYRSATAILARARARRHAPGAF